MSDDSFFESVTAVYSRAEALEDGVLVDCSTAAREAGIRFPIALTRAAWDLCVALSPAATRAGNDEAGRLWDVLWMLSCAIRRGAGKMEIGFEISCVTDGARASRVRLKAICGPGDDAEPVITILLPGES